MQLLRVLGVAWSVLLVVLELDRGWEPAQIIRVVATAIVVFGIVALGWARSRTTTQRHAVWLTVAGFMFDAVLLAGATAAAGIAGPRHPWEALLFIVALGGIRLQLPGAAVGWLLSMLSTVAVMVLSPVQTLSARQLVYQGGLAALMGMLFGLLSSSNRAAGREAATHLAELQQVHQWRSKLLGALGHDLRAPSAMASSLARTLHDHRSELDGKEQDEVAARIIVQVDRATRIADDLLTMLQAEQNALALERQPTDVRQAVEQAVAVSGVDATVDVTPGLTAPIDANRFEQALCNLLNNASRHGAPPISVTGHATTDDGGIVLAISDNGPGVDADDQSQLFDAFEHGDHVGSVGLGLWIVRTIVTAHDGTIRYLDNQPHGATFEIHLPT